MVVDGRWMFAKNLQTEAGYEIDSLDAPVLMGQLVCKLLSFAAPSPQTISGKQQFSHVEQSRKITVTTMSAGGEYGTPWHLAGTVERKSSAEVAFDLKFSFPNERGRTMLHLSGTWSGAARQKISDSTSLEGWTAYSLARRKGRRKVARSLITARLSPSPHITAWENSAHTYPPDRRGSQLTRAGTAIMVCRCRDASYTIQSLLPQPRN
jgi:hypothetical protein